MSKSNKDPALLTEADREAVMAEENFLFATQYAMQSLLNAKGLKYKDLALGLGVSEARVSQLFGDDTNNLTIRTIARIYHQLGEVPVITSQAAMERDIAEARGMAMPKGGWFFAADFGECDIGRGSEILDKIDEPTKRERRPTGDDWAAAETQLDERCYHAA